MVDYRERCYTLADEDKYMVCFGSFNDKETAKIRRNYLMEKGIKTVVTEKEV